MTGLNLYVYIPHASIAVFFQPCPWGKKDTNLNKKCVFKKKRTLLILARYESEMQYH